MGNAGEQHLVGHLVTHPPVEALGDGVLSRLAWSGIVQLDPAFAAPLSNAFEVNSVPLSLTITLSRGRRGHRFSGPARSQQCLPYSQVQLLLGELGLRSPSARSAFLSSTGKCGRAARRLSFTTRSAEAFLARGFGLLFGPSPLQRDQNNPQTQPQICAIGAGGRQEKD
jgi:hypothetical protein